MPAGNLAARSRNLQPMAVGRSGVDRLAVDRRAFLGTLAVGLTAALAGCGPLRGADAAGGNAGGPAGGGGSGGPGSGAPDGAGPGSGGPGQQAGAQQSSQTIADSSQPVFSRGPARPLPPIPEPRPGRPRVLHASPGGPGSTPQVALTIDDGYSAETVAGYVDFAERTGMPLTFSPNACYRHIWDAHAIRLRPLIEAGQVQIGNHTYTHVDLLAASRSTAQREVDRNEDWIQRTFGITSRPWFRPPYGRHSEWTDDTVAELGFTHILMWEGSFGDARLLTPQQLLTEARHWLTAGRIVLGHANHPTITHLFDQIIELIQERSLTPVTLDQMFGTSRAAG